MQVPIVLVVSDSSKLRSKPLTLFPSTPKRFDPITAPAEPPSRHKFLFSSPFSSFSHPRSTLRPRSPSTHPIWDSGTRESTLSSDQGRWKALKEIFRGGFACEKEMNVGDWLGSRLCWLGATAVVLGNEESGPRRHWISSLCERA